jgi:hypothetical protein
MQPGSHQVGTRDMGALVVRHVLDGR